MSGPAPPSIEAEALAWMSFWPMVSKRILTPASFSKVAANSRVSSSAGGMKLFHARWCTSRCCAKAGATPPKRPRLVPAATPAADFVNSRRVRPFFGAAPGAGFLVVFVTSLPPFLAHQVPMREWSGPQPGPHIKPKYDRGVSGVKRAGRGARTSSGGRPVAFRSAGKARTSAQSRTAAPIRADSSAASAKRRMSRPSSPESRGAAPLRSASMQCRVECTKLVSHPVSTSR